MLQDVLSELLVVMSSEGEGVASTGRDTRLEKARTVRASSGAGRMLAVAKASR